MTYVQVPSLIPQFPPTVYRFLITDLTTGIVKEELPLSNVSYMQALNAAGSFSGTIPLDHKKANTDNLAINRTCIYAERNGVLLWGGILSTLKVNLKERTLELGAEGFWSYFKRRYVVEYRQYPYWDQMDIVKDLILYAQGRGNSNVAPPALTGIDLPPNEPLPVIPLHGSPGDYRGDVGVILEKPVGAERSGVIPSLLATGESDDDSLFQAERLICIGDHIEQMSKEDSIDATHPRGFDFGIFPEYDSSGNIAKVFKISYPTMGIDSGLSLQLGALMLDLDYSVDGTKQANSVIGVGSGGGGQAPTSPRLPIYPDNSNPQPHQYPLYEKIVNFKGQEMPLSTLDALTAASYAQLKNPVESLKATVRYSDEFVLLVPHTSDFLLGDFIRVQVDEGWLYINDIYRIVEWGASLDEQGGETLSLTLSKTYSVQFS